VFEDPQRRPPRIGVHPVTLTEMSFEHLQRPRHQAVERILPCFLNGWLSRAAAEAA
jgi:hypothetical protein